MITPLQLVKERFGSKAKLVEAVAEVVEAREGEKREELEARLKHAPNRKLLHLLEVAKRAEGLGGKAKIIERIATLKSQSKDHPFRDRLKVYSMGRLVDLLQALERRAKA